MSLRAIARVSFKIVRLLCGGDKTNRRRIYSMCKKEKKKMADVGGRSENIDNTNRRATVRDHSTIFCTTNIGICSVMGPIFVQ